MAVVGVKSSQLLEVNEAAAGRQAEEEVPHWGYEPEHLSHSEFLGPKYNVRKLDVF